MPQGIVARSNAINEAQPDGCAFCFAPQVAANIAADAAPQSRMMTGRRIALIHMHAEIPENFRDIFGYFPDMNHTRGFARENPPS